MEAQLTAPSRNFRSESNIAAHASFINSETWCCIGPNIVLSIDGSEPMG